MRKAFKVATVFTGTAACAALLAPAAEAATGANAQQAEPATSVRNCTIGPKTHSMVFWWLSTAHHGPTCVGGANSVNVTKHLGVRYKDFCGGTNYGRIFTSPFLAWEVSGKFYTGYIPVHPGTGLYNLHSYSMEAVNISRWSGNDYCAT
jgi:hypothetical protein